MLLGFYATDDQSPLIGSFAISLHDSILFHVVLLNHASRKARIIEEAPFIAKLPHYLLDFNNKNISNLKKTISTLNAKELTKKEIINLIKSKDNL